MTAARKLSPATQAKIDALKLKIAERRAMLVQERVRGGMVMNDGRVLLVVAPPAHLAHMEAFD
jgi:hypothetical protein